MTIMRTVRVKVMKYLYPSLVWTFNGLHTLLCINSRHSVALVPFIIKGFFDCLSQLTETKKLSNENFKGKLFKILFIRNILSA